MHAQVRILASSPNSKKVIVQLGSCKCADLCEECLIRCNNFSSWQSWNDWEQSKGCCEGERTGISSWLEPNVPLLMHLQCRGQVKINMMRLQTASQPYQLDAKIGCTSIFSAQQKSTLHSHKWQCISNESGDIKFKDVISLKSRSKLIIPHEDNACNFLFLPFHLSLPCCPWYYQVLALIFFPILYYYLGCCPFIHVYSDSELALFVLLYILGIYVSVCVRAFALSWSQ